jgi:protein XRP2
VLVLVPDIFGLEFNQSMQVSDRLVDAVPGLACAMPDVFRGAPWKMSEFPPTDKAKFMAFIDAHPWDDSHVKRDVKAAFEALEARAADGSSPSSSLKRFTMGFCWGAMMALLANADAELKVDASAGAHPTFFGKEGEIAKKLRGPVLLLPTKGDPGEAVLEAVKSAGLPFADACRVRRFDDQVHGFMAARGDYKDEKVRAAAGEGVGEVAKFFGGLI